MIILANWKKGALYDAKIWRHNIDSNIIDVVL